VSGETISLIPISNCKP